MALPTPPYFVYPFGEGGNQLTPVPQPNQGSGSVSYFQGFGPNYSIPPGTTGSLPVPREQMNQLFNDLGTAVQAIQQWGVPIFITAAQNISGAFPYSMFAFAAYDDLAGSIGPRVYQSTVNTNTALPSPGTLPYANAGWRMMDFNANKMIFDNVTVTSAVTTYGSGAAVYWNGTAFDLAQANGGLKANMIGIYDKSFNRVYGTGSYYPSSNLSQSGGLTLLVAGQPCYLSPTTPGLVTATISPIIVGVADSTTSCYMNIQTNLGNSVSAIARFSLSTSPFAPTGGGSGSTTVIPFGTSQYNIGFTASGSTAYTFTATVAGYYFVTLSAYVTTGSTGTAPRIAIRKNGTNTGVITVSSTTASGTQQVSDIVQLAIGDHLDFAVILDIASTITLTSPDTTQTFFTAQLISN
jgi:hypothetical protein